MLPESTPVPARAHPRWRVLGQLWCLYAGYYLGRVNLAAAQGRMVECGVLTARQLGVLLAGHKALYAVGQVVVGRLADRLPPRVLLAVGLAGSGLANLGFTRLRQFPALAGTWAANGLLQACGWTPVVRTIANWFPAGLRDSASGLIGTSYLLGNGVSWALAGWLTRAHDWPAAFRIPGIACLLLALLALNVRRAPASGDYEGTTAPQEADGEPQCPHPYRSPRLWALAAGMAAFIFGHHGLLDWTPHYLAANGYGDAATAARVAACLPVGATVGCLLLTWLARGHRRLNGVALVSGCLLGLAALTASFPAIVAHLPHAAPAGLWVLGALSSAPASLMPCSMPPDLVGTGAAGASAGLVDAMGYAGSAVSGLVTGWLLDGGPTGKPSAAAWLRAWRTWPLGMVGGAGLVWLAFRGMP